MDHKDFSTCRLRPMKAMKTFCLWCMGFHRKYVKECTAKECPLYPYRSGKTPKNVEVVKDYEIVRKWLENH